MKSEMIKKTTKVKKN